MGRKMNPLVLNLLVISLVTASVWPMELAKRHNADKESNTMRIPSALCNGEAHALGMESGDIVDQQITASSSYNVQSVGPQNARLNREISGGAWCPSKQLNAAYSGNEWIQVDLNGPYVITGIATQGRFGNGMGVEYAEEYWIEFSRDNGTTWNKWTGMNADYKLAGNQDTYTAVKTVLSHPLVGINLIRIVPFALHQRTTCLRFELYGCRHDHTLPVSYSIPDGFKGSSLGDLRDQTYDGRHDFYGYLTGGLGQLTDGIKGDDNYKVNYGYEWVGWRTDGSDLSMVFKFDSVVNFTSATFYCHNLFSKDIQVFGSAKVWFSYDGNVWSKRPVEFEYMADLVLENARDVVVHLHHRAGMYIKFDLRFASKWILISEVTFDTQPIDENSTLGYEHLEYPFESLFPITTNFGDDQAFLPQTAFLLIFIILFAIICTIVLFLLRLHLRRKEKAGHIVVCMKDLATTPLYCEPKDFSSTSSTISNAATDPEYAVPDVANTVPIGMRPQPTSGHLNTNLNMFGAGFTRIFMGGNHLKNNNNNKTTPPIAVNGVKNGATTLPPPANISTSNVAYSTQKFHEKNAASYNVTKPIPSKTETRQYYASTDLIQKPKVYSSQTALPPIDQSSKMTSNTIYNKRKFASSAGVNDDVMTAASSTLKATRYTPTNGIITSSATTAELMDEMKCIPEVSEADIELIRKQFGYSRFGEVSLGKFRDYGKHNDLSPETEAASEEEEARTDKTYYNRGTGNETLVLLKTLEKEKLRADFVHEMKSKWFISAKSERVAKLIGYMSSPRSMAMVIECGDCDLSHFLRNCDKKCIGIQTLLHLGSEVAAGMKYLESLGYVHRDLSARNCIIYSNSLQVKITDIAAFITTNSHEYCNGVALRWTAPEALINGAYTTKSDVYSFGVTFWEILTYGLVRPHHELDDEAFVQKIFSSYESYINDLSNECSNSSIYYQATYASTGSSSLGNSSNSSASSTNDNDSKQQSQLQQQQQNQQPGTTRLSYRLALPRPTTCPAEIYDLMLECWQLNEHIRPSFRDITQFLSARNQRALVEQSFYA